MEKKNKEYKSYNYRFTPFLFGIIDGARQYAINKENDKVVVFVRGKKILLEEFCDFEVSSQIRLTKEEALDLIKGTNGFILSQGDFADLPILYTTSDEVELKEGDLFYWVNQGFIGVGRTCNMNSILFASNFPIFGKVENAVEFIIEN